MLTSRLLPFLPFITGTDLSPIQPCWYVPRSVNAAVTDGIRVPPNCYFEVDDCESEWEFSRPFDFIHARALAGSIRDFPGLYRRIMQNLKPGGYVEIVDQPTVAFSDDDSMDKAPYISEWMNLHNEACEKFGKRMDIAHCQKQWMIDAGFKNVKEEVFKVRLHLHVLHVPRQLIAYTFAGSLESVGQRP